MPIGLPIAGVSESSSFILANMALYSSDFSSASIAYGVS